jgi:hypothetical protein
MIARVNFLELNALGEQLARYVASERTRVLLSLGLQLIYIVISYILVGGACDSIVMLHET